MRSMVSGALLLVAALLAGCGGGEVFRVEVSGLNSGITPAAKRYILLPAERSTRPDDLQFIEFSRYVDAALQRKGYRRASDAEQADVAVFLDYGIGAPQQHTYSYNIPQWGQTGVASSQTTGAVSVYGNQARYSTQTSYTPTYGVTGYTTHVGTHTTHDRFIRLSAFELRSSQPGQSPRQLWSTSALSIGSSNDLRKVLPVMVVAFEPSLGESTGQNLRFEIHSTDERLAKLRSTPMAPLTENSSRAAGNSSAKPIEAITR